MTIPIDAALTTTLGSAFYTAAKEHIKPDEPLLSSPYYLWGMAYNVVVGMGLAITAYVMNPDWMWMYWLDASRLSAGFTVYVFFMYPAMYTFGFLITDQAEKLRIGGSLLLLAVLAAFLVLFILLAFGRIWNVGTTAQWDAGVCVPLIGPDFTFTPLATALTAGFVPAIISGGWLLRRFYKGLG